MAAYAALVSVMHIIEQIKHHPLPPICLDKKKIESLTKNVIFLQEFLEGYASIGRNEENGLESRILDAAYAAEDVIESHIVDRILAGSTSHCDQVEFGQSILKVIVDMDLIKNEVMKTKETGVRHQLQTNSTSSYSRQRHNTTMVGFDDALLEILDKLTGGGLNRQIIPIVGMGGMGKTTLARNVYSHPLIKEHFDILAWVTISQEYDARKALNEILCQANQDKGNSSENNEKQIGDDLYKYLFGRKYLIVMDDIWSIEAWDKIKFFFPDNNNGSRIIVTTRLSNLARRLSNSYNLNLRFLNFDESWDLFSKIVFPSDDYPLEMVEIGKKIVGNCRGLPLSIVVVGGFLAKSKYKREYWENIAENLISIVNSDNDEHCLKILQLSYNQLPVYLKPCFLYMGVFKEDREIRISNLVKLWVAEGFLKPVSSKRLEEVAKGYLNDLVDRNLIFIVKSRGKCVKIHDLLRDLCLRQAQAERFYSVITQHSFTIPRNQRRFIVSEANLEENVLDALLSMSFVRSMICYSSLEIYPSPNHRLLRVSGACDDALIIDDYYYFQENKIQLANLRYVVAQCIPWDSKFATSLHLLWNLQTLVIEGDYCDGFIAPAQIWNMPQLRHVQVQGYLCIPDPPIDDDIVLENLQTLTLLRNFKCGDEVVKRIPNIKKLGLQYIDDEVEESYLNNLNRLHQLKSLYCTSFPYHGTDFLHKLSFPHSLKKLALDASHVHWEDILNKIGSLPLLQKLELSNGFFTTHTWETVEGQFCSLKFLKIDSCADMEYWNSECSHFPRLEHLVLRGLDVLDEIPSGIGEIPTLQLIELYHCSRSVISSCKSIQEEQEELYGEDDVALRVRVQLSSSDYDALQDMASPNFELIQ